MSEEHRDILFTATHSMISTYFGSMTIVLKLPLTRAASTNGLHKYNGFWAPGAIPEGDAGGATSFKVGNVEGVGVGERLGPLGPERCIVRLPQTRVDCQSRKKKNSNLGHGRCHIAYPIELKKDMTCAFFVCRTGGSTDDVGRNRF